MYPLRAEAEAVEVKVDRSGLSGGGNDNGSN
jgi:hypothetical protein